VGGDRSHYKNNKVVET